MNVGVKKFNMSCPSCGKTMSAIPSISTYVSDREKHSGYTDANIKLICNCGYSATKEVACRFFANVFQRCDIAEPSAVIKALACARILNRENNI